MAHAPTSSLVDNRPAEEVRASTSVGGGGCERQNRKDETEAKAEVANGWNELVDLGMSLVRHAPGNPILRVISGHNLESQPKGRWTGEGVERTTKAVLPAASTD